MKVIKTPLEGLLEIEPRVFEDNRGYFFESFNGEKFQQVGLPTDFIQDNQSLSGKGVLRGLHYQNPPHSQAKLVRVINGGVLDVNVDIRKNSPTYGHWWSAILTAENKKSLLIPEGFAHGFLTLEDNTIFSYKCSKVYHPESEHGLLWNDPDLGIDWGIDTPLVSDKDLVLPSFKTINSAF